MASLWILCAIHFLFAFYCSMVLVREAQNNRDSETLLALEHTRRSIDTYLFSP